MTESTLAIIFFASAVVIVFVLCVGWAYEMWRPSRPRRRILVTKEPAAQAPSRTCLNCGHALRQLAKYCAHCGYEVDRQPDYAAIRDCPTNWEEVSVGLASTSGTNPAYVYEWFQGRGTPR